MRPDPDRVRRMRRPRADATRSRRARILAHARRDLRRLKRAPAS